MGEENYQKILLKISRYSGVEKEELERRVEAKRAKLSGLISREGAAQVIAAELGINFDNEVLKIEELLPGMRKVNCLGKVINLFPVRTFTRNGQENKVANFIIADETSNVKVVLWDVNHIDLVEKGQVKEEVVVEIGNGSVRENEIHLGSFSELKVSNKQLSGVKREKIVKEKDISEFNIGESLKTRAFIVQLFPPRFFYVCPECKKKATQEGEDYNCQEHGKVMPEKRAIINAVIDDGTGTIRIVLFHDAVKQLGFTNLEDAEVLEKERQEILGKEMILQGNVRKNNYFNNEELIIEQAQEVKLDELIKGLEQK